MKKNLILAVSAGLLIALQGCTHRLTDFTVISTKNYPVDHSNVELKKAPERVKGVDRAHVILFIPTGIPNMKEAIDKAIEKYPGAVGLADGVVKKKEWWALLYGQNSYIVEGTPIYPKDLDGDNLGNADDLKSAQSGNALLFYHEVKQGETLASVANQYSVTIGNIVKWNKLSSNELTVGEKLKIYVAE